MSSCDYASFSGSAASEPQEIQQISQRASRVSFDLCPLLQRVNDVTSAALRLLDLRDGTDGEVLLLNRPIEHSLHDRNDVVLGCRRVR